MLRKKIATLSIIVWFAVALATMACGLLAVRIAAAKPAGTQYRLVPDWAQVPAGETFGGVAGTAFDAKGNLFVFRRAFNMWVLDPHGKFLRAWGENLAKTPHGLRIDREGFVWITDSAGHQVKKFRPDGTLVMTLGKYGVPGDGPDTFDGPSDLVIARNGDIFVADGHQLPNAKPGVPANHRVVKLDKNGKFIKAWGTQGSGPGQFELPHAIAQDSRGRLLVADGTNKRIEIFDTDGKFLEQWTNVGDPYGLDIDKDDIVYVGDHEGGKVMILDGRKDGKLLQVIDGVPEANSLSVDRYGNIYVAATQEHYWATQDSPKTMCCLAKFSKMSKAQ